jgi:hypothetical protein
MKIATYLTQFESDTVKATCLSNVFTVGFVSPNKRGLRL